MPNELGSGGGLAQQRRISRDLISLDVPTGWEASIRRGVDADGSPTYPVLHASTVPLPLDRGDYGSGLVESLSSTDVFLSLVEFGPEAVATNLFPTTDQMPDGIAPEEFRTSQLQRAIPGQAGKQIFFSYRGRAFCLYVVLGSFAFRGPLSTLASEVMRNLSIGSGPIK